MNEHGESDSPIGPEKLANNVWLQHQPTAEPVEERGPAEGNPNEQTSRRAQDRERLPNALDRIRAAVRKDREQRMTKLWHHVCDLARLREAYFALNRKGAAGIDGETWQMYGEDLIADKQVVGHIKKWLKPGRV